MELVVPPRIPEQTIRRVQELAVAAFVAADCEGMARVDFFVRKDGEVLVNELNTIPGFTSTSVYAKLFEASGIPYAALLERLVDLALERRDRRAGLRSLSRERALAGPHFAHVGDAVEARDPDQVIAVLLAARVELERRPGVDLRRLGHVLEGAICFRPGLDDRFEPGVSVRTIKRPSAAGRAVSSTSPTPSLDSKSS